MAASPPSSSFSSPLSSSSSCSPPLYLSSCSSLHSESLLTTNPSSPSWSPSYRQPSHARDRLENLIARHGPPTGFSLSSLEELTATTSSYNPPSPLSRPSSPTADLSDSEKLTHRTKSRPIPIPKPAPSTRDEDLPVTPLTGRFETDYFPYRNFDPERNRDRRTRHTQLGHRSTYHHSSRMRSDSSTFYPAVVPQPMAPSGRSDSPQPSNSRAQNTAKSASAFHLGNLPQFHPAVYQSSSDSQSQTLSGQPPSPRQSRQQAYRTGSTSRGPMMQYLVEGVVLQRTPSRPLSPSPAAPRLNPLRSPGPVTPLALEEAGGYLAAGSTNSSELSSRGLQQSAPAPDMLERLIVSENERLQQKAKITTKGW